MKNKGQKLTGMKEICAYAYRSEATIMSWILREGFPAQKDGEIWVSDTNRIDSFYRVHAMRVLG
jgi:hypothetical protein